jgi:hypothetical protein
MDPAGLMNDPSQSSGLRFPFEFVAIHSQVPGLGPRVSGSGYQVQVRVRGNIQVLNLYPNLHT